jgi:hypothetical protein
MIPKSGNRFSEKIMRKHNVRDETDSARMDQTLSANLGFGCRSLPRCRHRRAVNQPAFNPTRSTALEHFPAKWEPVRRRKCDQIRNLERVSDSIETKRALAGHDSRPFCVSRACVEGTKTHEKKKRGGPVGAARHGDRHYRPDLARPLSIQRARQRGRIDRRRHRPAAVTAGDPLAQPSLARNAALGD